MKVGFITTIDTNIGDDFIRQGIMNLLHATFNERIVVTNVNKHFPYTIYPAWHPLRYLQAFEGTRGVQRLTKLSKSLTERFGLTRFDDCDLIIQSGAPVLWPDCQTCEWNVPIWQEVIGRLYQTIPVFNIAAGSCYPWERQPMEFAYGKEGAYAQMIGSFCKVTTTRDTLAHKLFGDIGIDNTLLPCSAFFVDATFQNAKKKEYVLVNYMSGAGHFDWEQKIDKLAWERDIRSAISYLKRNHEVRFICHDEREVELAKKLDPTLRIHFPKSVTEYVECVRAAKIGINNRMHASVAMASVGVPSVSICTDTRLLMLANIGLPHFYVKDLTYLNLIEHCDSLLNNARAESERLFNLKRLSFEKYKEVLSTSFQ